MKGTRIFIRVPLLQPGSVFDMAVAVALMLGLYTWMSIEDIVTFVREIKKRKRVSVCESLV